jgi:polyisoprenoid-binding protein YceI
MNATALGAFMNMLLGNPRQGKPRLGKPRLGKPRLGALSLALFAATLTAAAAQDSVLQLDSARTTVRFTLDAALHSVHGTFRLKQGTLRLDPASGKLSGEIVVDAQSGETGNGMRDRKMHREILESTSYPEIGFRPDRVEGNVAALGKSSVKVHGIFKIHGIDREILVPADVDMAADHWNATVHFTIPYAKWGMENPSTFFLRVSDWVEIDLAAAGSLARNTSAGGNSAQ